MVKRSEEKIELGLALKRLRQEKNMSIQELSRKTGISASYIVRIESGERRNPTFTLLEKLLTA